MGKKRSRGGERKEPISTELLPISEPQDKILEGRELQSRPSTSTRASYRQSFEMRRGPIPDAAELVRYGQAHPEAPKIILDEFQSQSSHRRTLEREMIELDKRALDADILSERLGLVAGLIVALVGFGCATFLVSTGHDVAGTSMFGLDMAGLVWAFIAGRPQAASDEEEAAGQQAPTSAP